jgi:hypothetical protein
MTNAFETLTTSPVETLRRLATFIGADADDEWLRAAAGLARPLSPRWTALSREDRVRLSDACAPGMRLLYGSLWDPAEPRLPELDRLPVLDVDRPQ